ncbi:MAG: hypothetical protein D6743_02800, partial [Calditrichaeota bacterium]
MNHFSKRRVVARLSCLAILFSLLPAGLLADGGGKTGMAFLKLGVGARASGLGEAYSTVADDATATYWNPAGLALLARPEFAFTHTEWVQDISNEFVAFAFPAFGGAVGISFYANNVGGIEQRVNPSPEPLSELEANDIAFGVSYGRQLSRNLSAGFTVKYLYEKIFVESAAGYAFDFGATVKPLDSSLKLSIVAQNLGSMGNFAQESIRLPATIRVGAAYPVQLPGSDLEESWVLFSVEAVKVVDSDVRGNFGAELQLRRRLAFRFGYQTGFDQRGVGGGFGVRFKNSRLDYGFTPFQSS